MNVRYNREALAALGSREEWDQFRAKFFAEPRPTKSRFSSITTTYGATAGFGGFNHSSIDELVPVEDYEWEISLREAPLSGKNLVGFDFTRTDLMDAEVNGANLSNARFKYPPFLSYNLATPPILKGTHIDLENISRIVRDQIGKKLPDVLDIFDILPEYLLEEYDRQNPGHEEVEAFLGFAENIKLAREIWRQRLAASGSQGPG